MGLNTDRAAGPRVRLVVSDPWEVGEVSFLGALISQGFGPEEGAIMKLDAPFEYEGLSYAYLLVSPRHEGHGLQGVEAGEQVSCNAMGVPGDPESTEEVLNYSASWRGGGLAVIGSISLA